MASLGFCFILSPVMRAQLIVALDVPALDEAEAIVAQLGPAVGYYKVGSQLFTRAGPAAVEMLRQYNKQVFLDLKFHDIPHTVAAAAEAAAALGVAMFNVHVAGGAAMMEAAAKAVAALPSRPRVLGVTVLTSQSASPKSVLDRARQAKTAGLDGVVVSAQEAVVIRKHCGAGFVIVTPGVRPAGAEKADQKRVVTPREAVAAGADYLVVGRPILAAANPAGAARAVLEEMAAAG